MGLDAPALEKQAAGKTREGLDIEERKMSLDKKIKSNKALLFLTGGAVLVLGITLILVWWPDVVSFFKGLIGMTLSVGGLLLLYMIKE